MHPALRVAIAASIVAVAASAANATLITYKFNGNVTGNFMTGGAFASAPIGAPFHLQFTVETSTTPTFSDANRNIWDAVPGTITALKAKVNGISSTVTPDTPDRARVVNDALLSGGPNHFDQFWVEMPAVAATPDFEFARVILSTVEPTPVVSSSLTGIGWPTNSSQLSIPSFTNEHQLHLRGPLFTDNIYGSIRSAEVLVPAPAAATLILVAAPCLNRRRRARA